MLFLKLSLCTSFLRILVSRLQRSIVYAIAAIPTIINLVNGIWVNFICGVPDDHFIPKILAHKCAPRRTQAGMAYSQAVVNTLTDIALAALPIWLLWNMQMRGWAKFSVGGILILATGYVINPQNIAC
jgi:hypothetical protein